MTASELLMQFLLAVVSGLVAGLSAGWVLMRWQLRTQLASDDISRIIEMLHSLERIREKIAEAEGQVLFGSVGAKDNLQSEIRSALQALDEEVAARAHTFGQGGTDTFGHILS